MRERAGYLLAKPTTEVSPGPLRRGVQRRISHIEQVGWMLGTPRDGIGKRVFVGRRDNQAGAAVHDGVGGAGVSRRDDGKAVRERFRDDHAESVAECWQDEHTRLEIR